MSDWSKTMAGVRDAVQAVVIALQRQGYVFAHPKRAFVHPASGTQAELTEIESRVGPIPAALRAAWEIVGSYDLTGSHPAWPVPACLRLPGAKEGPDGVWLTDPIVLHSPADVIARLDDAGDVLRDRIPVWPDAYHKAGYSGSPETCVAVGSTHDDPRLLEGDPTVKRPAHFGAYLTWALADFAGFPGFAELGADAWPGLADLRRAVPPTPT